MATNIHLAEFSLALDHLVQDCVRKHIRLLHQYKHRTNQPTPLTTHNTLLDDAISLDEAISADFFPYDNDDDDDIDIPQYDQSYYYDIDHTSPPCPLNSLSSDPPHFPDDDFFCPPSPRAHVFPYESHQSLNYELDQWKKMAPKKLVDPLDSDIDDWFNQQQISRKRKPDISVQQLADSTTYDTEFFV